MGPDAPSVEDPAVTTLAPHPTFRQAFLYWLRLGFVNFGGPTGQIAMMHRDLVEKRRWISDQRFLHALNYCMLLPGPEAQQLAIYVGWLLHRTLGGLVAGALFVLPSVVVLQGLAWVYVTYGDVPAVSAFFYGLKAVILAVVLQAVYRIGKRSLNTWPMLVIAAGAFLSLAVLNAPFPVVILAAGVLGYVGHRFSPTLFRVAAHHGVPPEARPDVVLGDSDETPPHALPSARRAVAVLGVGASLWMVPMILLFALREGHRVFFDSGFFFSKAALVTFGGAYAVLAYIGRASVETYHWLSPHDVINGLGLAETTPGPLIMVTCFIGFLAGYRFPGGLNPTLSGIIGGLVATYFTFLFSFLFIFLGAPHIERLRGNQNLNGGLSAVTAAVVGVILNLALFFGRNVILTSTGIDWFSAGLGFAALLVLTLFGANIIPVILSGAAIGFAWKLLHG